MADKVRYKVVAPCFVNDVLVSPGTAAKPVYVEAAPGLQGKALKLEQPEAAPDSAVAAAPKPAVVKA